MLNQLKKAALIGVGGTAIAFEKTAERIDYLVHKGKLSVEEGKELTSKLTKRKNGDEITDLDRDELEALLIEMNVAQRKDVDQLEKKSKNYKMN